MVQKLVQTYSSEAQQTKHAAQRFPFFVTPPPQRQYRRPMFLAEFDTVGVQVELQTAHATAATRTFSGWTPGAAAHAMKHLRQFPPPHRQYTRSFLLETASPAFELHMPHTMGCPDGCAYGEAQRSATLPLDTWDNICDMGFDDAEAGGSTSMREMGCRHIAHLGAPRT